MVLIALLAVVRKLIILDLKDTDAMQLLALAAAILALGAVYRWCATRTGNIAPRLRRSCARHGASRDSTIVAHPSRDDL